MARPAFHDIFAEYFNSTLQLWYERSKKMRFCAKILLAGVAFLWGTVSANAQQVAFTNISDALASRCYDSSLTAPDPINPNQLKIGINMDVGPVDSGLGGVVYWSRGCVASTAAFTPRSTMYTISFVIEAPEHYYISKITFTQTGSAVGSRGGQAFIGATWVVDNHSVNVLISVIPKFGKPQWI